MKKVILADGTELSAINILGEKKTVQGARRDTLTFIFADADLNELDTLFSADNCETIQIIEEDESVNVYSGYTIRAALSKTQEKVQEETTETEAVYENRVTVAMAQRTYQETLLAQIASESTDTQLAVAELAEIVMGGAE